ncbi:MAG: hypothetical protein AUJ20_01630 [Comamonadaceae bacterium CG1_02_60_18]|nr:MAG: hypothetical protein AUJ20_01630 [Comamonadaceae bacterium CG1_02_60_18]
MGRIVPALIASIKMGAVQALLMVMVPVPGSAGALPMTAVPDAPFAQVAFKVTLMKGLLPAPTTGIVVVVATGAESLPPHPAKPTAIAATAAATADILT